MTTETILLIFNAIKYELFSVRNVLILYLLLKFCLETQKLI